MPTEVMFESAGAVGRMTFSDAKGVNILSTPVFDQIERRLDEIARAPAMRVLILTGAGKTFVAGADIAEMNAASPDAGKAFSQRGQRCLNRLARFDQCVTIAAINGAALGGGCELALACDMRIISEEAKIALPEVKLGLIPGWGGTQRTYALLGAGGARKLLFTGEAITGKQAADMGLAEEAVAKDQVVTRAEEIAKQILTGGPEAIRAAKRVMLAGDDARMKEGFAAEAAAFGEVFGHDEGREGLKAFLEKRKASWNG